MDHRRHHHGHRRDRWVRCGFAAQTVRMRCERLVLEIGPPAGEELVVGSNAGSALVSPDGSMVAFLSQGAAGRRLHVRSLMTGEVRAISGSEGAYYPFWSPDSRSLAFFGSSKLLTVSIAGGLPEAIADYRAGPRRHLDRRWARSCSHHAAAASCIASRERGGTVEAITTLDVSRGENAHYWPVALARRPELPVLRPQHAPREQRHLSRFARRASPPVRLVTSLSSGLYAPSRDGGPDMCSGCATASCWRRHLISMAGGSPERSRRSPPTFASRKASVETSRAYRSPARSSGHRRRRLTSSSPGTTGAESAWASFPFPRARLTRAGLGAGWPRDRIYARVGRIGRT